NKYLSIFVYTIVVSSLKDYLDKRAQDEQILAVDLLEPLINVFKTRFNKEPHHRPGLTRKLDDDYFRKIKAVEFAVKYDDGKDPPANRSADDVLNCGSRSSTTRPRIYLCS